METGKRPIAWKRRIAVAAPILLIALFAATVAHGAGGDLSQKPPPDGCVTQSLFSGCNTAADLLNARGIAVSPDGENVYVTTSAADAILIFDRDPATGALDRKDGVEGCISETGSSSCQDGVGLVDAEGVAVSPDGTSVYVAAFGSDAITAFDRDPATGELDQKTDLDACVSENTTGGLCGDGVAMVDVIALEVSPDGNHVYAVSLVSDAVTVFDRDESGTATNGALTQKTGSAACISEAPIAGASCDDGKALNGVGSLTISSDGASVYTAAGSSDAVAIFDRDEVSGEISQKPGTLGCISEGGTGGACQDGTEIGFDIVLSPDQSSMYTASISDAIAIFDRNTSNGRVTQKVGAAGCISETGTGALCQDGFLLDGAYGAEVSPDGRSVFVGATTSDAVTSFARSASGALTQRTGPGACVSNDGSGGLCADGSALDAPGFELGIAPQGNSLYAFSFNGTIAILDIEPFTEPPAPAPQPPAAGDSAAPDTQITAGPKKKEKKKQATFEFTSSEAGSTFQCKLDDGGFETCTSPEDVKAGKGKHTFEVRARDAAGNVDPTPAVQKWTVKKKKKKKA